ncbi:hypothetical protein O9K51_01921 [Purpureocillium lavendulum]|uniref:Uncharacterized protein n=1 Tax=Purpureocillium lavendulum TaxID=1247861 RepID=A0AB34G9I6_9HYPO|nr:hypothetical protein O9K51_01921 [Purpureocillium lavendulum]
MSSNPAADMTWYIPWLSCQLANLPQCLREFRFVKGNVPVTALSLVDMASFIAESVVLDQGCSIDELILSLHERGGYFDQGDNATDAAHRLLVFAALGWTSMLYQPAFNVCSLNEFAIHQDATQPDSGLVFHNYKLPADFADRPLHALLRGFGNLLPAPPQVASPGGANMVRSAASWTALYPTELNAHILHEILGVHFRWVDSLALHLDYDKSTHTLSLFAFPSQCVHMLYSRGPIFAFASNEPDGAEDPRADADDIRDLLREVLMSYRLLFAQCRKARKLFRRISSSDEIPFSQPDALLSVLCVSKSHNLSAEYLPEDRPVYFIPRDFCMLSERLQLILRDLENVRPKSMVDLVRDKRDTVQYWTFWLVAIIGGVGILLSLTQVVLQVVQLAQQASQSK